MNTISLFSQDSTSPFDAIKRDTVNGERWSARDLMPLLGYIKWQKFEDAIDRARVAISNSGIDVSKMVTGAGKVAASGPNAQDYILTRYACYMVAMNGDPRKPEIAAAQTYFAVKTHEAETSQPKALSRKDLALMIIQAEEELEATNAKLLAAAPAILIGERNLEAGKLANATSLAKQTGISRYKFIGWAREHNWMYKHDTTPTEYAIENGYMAVLSDVYGGKTRNNGVFTDKGARKVIAALYDLE